MTDDPHKAHAASPVYSEGEIDLRQLARALWVYRVLIAAMATIGLLASLAAVILTTRTVSQTLFLTPDLSLKDYKQYESVLDNEHRVRQFISAAGLQGTYSEQRLLKLFKSSGGIWTAMQPVFSLTGRDEKAFDIKTDEVSGLVGFQLTMPRGKPEDKPPILGLAEYLRSTIVEVDLQSVALEECAKFQIREQELRNEQIRADFKTRQQQERADSIRALIAANPGSGALDNRQVVSLKDGGEKFLSPMAQLMAAEIDIADMRVETHKRLRDRTAAEIKKAYYCRAKKMLRQPRLGQGYLAQLKSIGADVLKDFDSNADVVEQTVNELEIQRQDWEDKYLERARFVASTNGVEKDVRITGIGTALALGGLAGLLLGALLALLIAWWHDNRDAVVHPTEG